VFIRGVTYNRDSNGGFFDYQSNSITKKAWTTQEQARILRKDKDLRIVPLKSASSAEKVEVDYSQFPY